MKVLRIQIIGPLAEIHAEQKALAEEEKKAVKAHKKEATEPRD